MIFVIDIDGTVADNNHRMGFVQGSKKDWDQFYRPELMEKDLPIPAAQKKINELIVSGKHYIIFLTGRPERTRNVTAAWIAKHLGILLKPTELIMRSDNDWRKASVYKAAWAEKMRAHLGYQDPIPNHWPAPFMGLVFIDDDNRCWETYEKFGMCLRAPGCWENFPHDL